MSIKNKNLFVFVNECKRFDPYVSIQLCLKQHDFDKYIERKSQTKFYLFLCRHVGDVSPMPAFRGVLNNMILMKYIQCNDCTEKPPCQTMSTDTLYC